MSKASSKNAKPCRVSSRMVSVSRCAASEVRQKTPSGTTRSPTRYSPSTRW
jgi:hypothetical protein